MEDLFAYHVEQKTFSEEIAKRSIKLFIEQFDPHKQYLLQSEVEPWLALSDRRLSSLVASYYQDAFPDYIELAGLFKTATRRYATLRKAVAKEVIAAPLHEGEELSRSHYASTEAELRHRLKNDLLLSIATWAKQRGLTNIDKEAKVAMVSFWERKMGEIDEAYHKIEKGGHTCFVHMLKAMAKSLDAHTAYYSPDEAYDIRAVLHKQVTGIGIVLREEFDGIFIANVVDGGPAKASGKIHPGDRLTHINGHPITHSSFSDVLTRLKGKEGSSMTLGLERKGRGVFQVSLKRSTIVMDDQRLRHSFEPVADGVIGTITLPAFYDNGGSISAERDLRDALRDLRSHGPIKGLVLDMRRNSGGFLNQAVKVAGLFLTGGVIVISQYADGEVSYARDIDGRRYYSGPLVILTSKASASAAEIVAQALQDHGVAVIVGDERTYGKGSMQYQTLTDPKADTFFKVTVGRYYTASGRSPQIKGVIADIHVPTAFAPYRIGERYLEYPLSGAALTEMLLAPANKRLSHGQVVPYLTPRETPYRKIIPILSSNSETRIKQSPNFAFYKKKLAGEIPPKPKQLTRKTAKTTNHGVVDLQMTEAVAIVKDMLYLQTSSL
jgi:carboxyl-terminal processing protease